MLTPSLVLCGRWGARDFLRGRSKRGGAIHTRHTHGSKGRYKRLSSGHGLRDGRRHAANHMQGGLGVKLGGGLFGLRIPRQHMLSTMTKEEFDIEMYGHPNITNPYRDHLDEHPALKAVMQNATLETTVVVLLPRASRTPPSGAGASSSSTSFTSTKAAHKEGSATPIESSRGATTPWLPPSWLAVVDDLCAALTSTGTSATAGDDAATTSSPETAATTATTTLPRVNVYLSTLESSTLVPLTTGVTGQTQREVHEALSEASRTLYARLCKGRTLTNAQHGGGRATRPTTSLSSGHAHGTFLGTALKSSPLTTAGLAAAAGLEAARTAPITSTRAQRKLKALECHLRTETGRDAPASSSPSSSHANLTSSLPPPVQNSPSSSSSTTTVAHGAQQLLRDLHRRAPMALCVCARVAPQINATSTSPTKPRTARAAPLLKADIDSDVTAGVWQRSPASLSSLLRWHYNAHDPRAHNGDAIPHEQRRLPLIVLLDASKLVLARPSAAAPRALASRPSCSLVSDTFSQELLSDGFYAVPPTSFAEVTQTLDGWACDSQWRARVAHEREATVLPDPTVADDVDSTATQVRDAA